MTGQKTDVADPGADAVPTIGISMSAMLAALLALVMVALVAFSVIGTQKLPAESAVGSD